MGAGLPGLHAGAIHFAASHRCKIKITDNHLLRREFLRRLLALTGAAAVRLRAARAGRGARTLRGRCTSSSSVPACPGSSPPTNSNSAAIA